MALQYRPERGANTQDIEIDTGIPRTVRLEKRGDTFTVFVSMNGEPPHQIGASTQLHLKEPFYVGIGAVSHDVATTDKFEFSRVSLQRLGPVAPDTMQALHSTLQVVQIDDQFRRAMVIRSKAGRMRSPGWSPGGTSVYVHDGGRILRIPYPASGDAGTPQEIDVGKLVDCSGNFGPSPDGEWLAVSCAATKGGPHEVYVLPTASGGAPRKVTSGTTASFFHAWAPNSKTVLFTRGSAGKTDIFAIAVTGGAETRLTSDTLNDGPDCTPDGKLIYFDSSRSGTTQIWRMKSDGSDAEQVTDDDQLNSSPHVSPDGKTVAFLSQPPDGGQGIGKVALRTFSPGDGLIRTVLELQGDRDSMAMNSWADAKHVAFVSYQWFPVAHGPEADLRRPPITGVSHIALYAANPADSERFYGRDLGGIKRGDPENARGTRYFFAPSQFVEILPLPAGSASINRLDHVAFTTTDVEHLRSYLASRQIGVPNRVERGADGSAWIDVVDPEGNRIEFVQPPENLPDIPVNTLSSHIIHVGFIVHNRQREDAFFRTVLGFRPYWFGGMKDDVPTWISQQVPDGTDWLEYMMVGAPQETGIPPSMGPGELGVLNHFSLGVPSAETAYTVLWNGDRLTGQTNLPKIGRDAKWQLNLIDPDGTRAELMELHAIGKPCCSPFTESDPQN
jgi:catechol 2,3-dioxygenase-like lactoylglutathione lyase family enzyme